MAQASCEDSIYTPELGIGVTFLEAPLEFKANAEPQGKPSPGLHPRFPLAKTGVRLTPHEAHPPNSSKTFLNGTRSHNPKLGSRVNFARVKAGPDNPQRNLAWLRTSAK